MNIYLDTNLWNLSCDQRIDPKSLLPKMERSGNSMVLGIRELKLVPESRLAAWLATEATSRGAIIMLTGHIGRNFPQVRTAELLDYAAALIKNASSLISRAIVRADLYYNWRCANRGSNPPDLADDLYHVLNASYCEIYATDDRRQAEYASYILPSTTKVAIYDRSVPLDAWLQRL